MADVLLAIGGVLCLILSVLALRKHWNGTFDEERMVREGVPRRFVTALGAIGASTPLFGICLILATEWSLDTRVGFVALMVLWPAFILLACSLFFFMFPRFLIPPPIRHRQSLASRVLHGARQAE